MDLFSQVSEASTSRPNGAAGKTYSTASGTILDKKSLNTIGPKPKATAILPKPILPNGADQLTLFPVAFHASPTQAQGNASAKKMNAIYGPKCLEQYERLPQVSSWAKMYAALLIGTGDWYSTRCKLTWKISGIKSRPFLYLRRQSMPRTAVIEYGLLPTPMAQGRNTTVEQTIKRKEKYGGIKTAMYLEHYAVMGLLPTPRAAMMPNSESHIQQGKIDSLMTMATLGMLPTPNTRDWKDTIGNGKDSPSIGQTRGYSLGQKVNSIHQPTGTTSQLNPRFVAEMMGFPPNWTELPFQNGETKVSKPTAMP